MLPNISTLMRTPKMSKSLKNANILLMLLAKFHFFAFSLSLFLYIHKKTTEALLGIHCVKSVQIWSFFWSVFSRICTEYGEIRSTSLYSVQMRKNTNQKKTPYLDSFYAVIQLFSSSIPNFP